MAQEEDESEYSTIRETIGFLIGKKVADISQHDEEDYDPGTREGGFVMLLFEDGSYLKFYAHPSAETGDVFFEFERG